MQIPSLNNAHKPLSICYRWFDNASRILLYLSACWLMCLETYISSLVRKSKLEIIGLVDTLIVFAGTKSLKRLCRMLSYTPQHQFQVRLGKGTGNSVNSSIWAVIGTGLAFPSLGWDISPDPCARPWGIALLLQAGAGVCHCSAGNQ